MCFVSLSGIVSFLLQSAKTFIDETIRVSIEFSEQAS